VRLYDVHLSLEVRIFFIFSLIVIPAIDIPASPVIPLFSTFTHTHTHPHSQTGSSLTLSLVYMFLTLVWHKPCVPYAIYVLAFNVPHPKSLSFAKLLLTVPTAGSWRHTASGWKDGGGHGYAQASETHPSSSPHGRKTMGRIWKRLNWVGIVGVNVFQ